ncbi:MAG TPA: glycosyltransferase family 87 protein [Candidatus Limnocylindrales bacterium]
MLRTSAWLALVALAVLWWLLVFGVLGFDPSTPGSDAWNYLAAGERLNAGHPLYALSPGDRPITLVPPYWTVPLLAPPPIAVVWRPLALLGDPAMTLWAGAGLLATLATAGWLLVRGGLATAAIVAVLAAPIAIQSLAGNANAFLFGILVLAWVFRARPAVVGSLVAAAIAIKLTPVLLLLWLATARRWHGVGATALALAVIGVVSLAGAGLQNHLDWLASVPQSVPAPTSLAGITGISSTVLLAIAAIVVLGVSRRGDERLTFSVAVVAAALVSPALYLGTFGIAAASAAAWIPERGSVLASLRAAQRPRPTTA